MPARAKSWLPSRWSISASTSTGSLRSIAVAEPAVPAVDQLPVHAREHGVADALVIDADRAYAGGADAADELGAAQLRERGGQVEVTLGELGQNLLAQRPSGDRHQLEHGARFRRQRAEPLRQRMLEADADPALDVRRRRAIAAHVLDQLGEQVGTSARLACDGRGLRPLALAEQLLGQLHALTLGERADADLADRGLVAPAQQLEQGG